MPGSEIKAVIFDLGGVVFESPIKHLKMLEEKMKLPRNALNRRIFGSPAWSRMERGIITPERFVQEYNQELEVQNIGSHFEKFKHNHDC